VLIQQEKPAGVNRRAVLRMDSCPAKRPGRESFYTMPFCGMPTPNRFKTPNNPSVSSEVLEWRAAGWQRIIGHGLAPWIVRAAAMHQICKLAARALLQNSHI
jgi:hypothetical protein